MKAEVHIKNGTVIVWPKGGNTQTVVTVSEDEVIVNRPGPGTPERIKL